MGNTLPPVHGDKVFLVLHQRFGISVEGSALSVSMYLQIAYARTQQQQHKHCYLEIVCLRLEVVQALCSLLECLRVHCYRLFAAE